VWLNVIASATLPDRLKLLVAACEGVDPIAMAMARIPEYIDLLLTSPQGDAVKNALRLDGGEVFTEILKFLVRPAPGQPLACELAVLIARVFGMLTSGDPTLCGHAMANLQVFYPELSLPDGSSNLDPPELW
jgi:hypothetical protein